MFKKVTSRVSFPRLEEDVIQFWKLNDIFRKSEEDQGKPLFMLYEGPPTANGSPGIHHVLARVFKDIICRYKTMKGFRPLRKGGWDTHGLPVELEIERELGLKSKREIEEYGIEKFNQKCRDSVFRYVKEWEELTERVGFWVDMDNPYVTLDRSYIETCWWILKEFWGRGLIYKGMKGTPHCPRCVSSLSSHEVALGYKENTPDPSVYIKFLLKWNNPKAKELLKIVAPGNAPNNGKLYFLAWTTTPWTLPGNTALAVAPEADYSVIQVGSEDNPDRLVVASALVASVIKEPHQLIATVKGDQLTGISYEKLYDPVSYNVEISSYRLSEELNKEITTLQPTEDFNPTIIGEDFVSLEDGTGIVHIAPAFGDEDLSAGRKHGLAFVQPVDLQGIITGNYPFSGMFVKDADERIITDLAQKGLLYHREVYHHTYPFCWRCNTPLLYYAKESWYIQTTAVKDQLISGNQKINWYPGYIKDGRFGEWLRNGVDWAISRERYWGTPLPFWQCELCEHYHCVGTMAELKDMSIPESQPIVDNIDPHRPYIDDVVLSCPKCPGRMRRIPEVIDAWFDSGAMPLAQWNITSKDQFIELQNRGRFPAKYISEAVDQTRGWFYSLLAISVLMCDRPSYENVICLGLILDDKGHKMSKSQGNVVNPWDVLNTQGADAIRWYLFTATQPGDSRRFSQGLVDEVVRRFMLTLWNVYSFFVTYALIDGYLPKSSTDSFTPVSELDRWILSELNSLVGKVGDCLESYDPTNGGRSIQEFVNLLSNWYVRRSRRRFWRSGDDSDKLSAYSTLYTCLVSLSKLLAPYTPFLAEEMYQNLVRRVDTNSPESVHLASFPVPERSLVDKSLMESTRLAMRLSSLGRDARSRSGKKVRLPLQKLLIKTREPTEETYISRIREQLLDELNVKEIKLLSAKDPFYQRILEGAVDAKALDIEGYQVVLDSGYMIALDTTVNPTLFEEGLAREFVHRMQNLRRASGFEVTDRIASVYRGPPEVRKMMTTYSSYIRTETLSVELCEGDPPHDAHVQNYKLEGMEITLGISRVE